jgi:GNAT superfamily N-acetyltransferase
MGAMWTNLIKPIDDASEKAELCARLTEELPKWFGRTEANAAYKRGIATRDCYATKIDQTVTGLIALDYHFATTCNLWWLAVSPPFHRHGVGRALVDHARNEARKRSCHYAAVETVSPRIENPEYEQTRRFYSALGFKPFVEFEPESGDFMMWMVRRL